jgi:hypothetical protein
LRERDAKTHMIRKMERQKRMYPSIYSYIRERERERERENGQAESIRIGKQGSSRGKRMNESCERQRERERERERERFATSDSERVLSRWKVFARAFSNPRWLVVRG